MKKLTVKDLLDGKGKNIYTYVQITTPEQASAAESAGIDMIGTGYNEHSKNLPASAPNTHFQFGLKYGKYASATEALREAFKAMEAGADTIYCAMSFDVISKMAKEGIPVVGHVGLVPPICTWTGGLRAVGKTTSQALQIYENVKAYEDAGAMGVEIELVPHKIATEIAKRTSLLTISLGSGSGCDVQYLFSSDILGETSGHIPRHAKVYRDLPSEYSRVQRERVAAYKEYINDIKVGEFPSLANLVEVDGSQYEQFLEQLEMMHQTH